jgi:alkanesulfonate monooxygenase SsuD/methylene tetrahydromethanopterin reductase-like flavin-dependent oxidoreductase (luciferase family)
MIKRFGTLYAGQVDLEGIGFEGPSTNSRWHSNEQLVTVFDTAKKLAKSMDRLGFDTLWFAEHHFQREGYECIPNILMLAVHLAHLTTNLRIGCGFNVAPMWHPLRLAEDYAMADVLTGGRVIFGVGRGYHSREIETFAAPLLDQDANRELFEEQVEVIMKAFREESFAHHGKHYDLPPPVPYRGYTLENLTLVPRPVNQPVECWQPIQGGTARALDFMAKHGLKGTIGGGVAEGGAMDNVVLGYRDAYARIGRELQPGEDLNVGFQFHIAPTVEQALREAAPYYEENVKMFGPLRLHRGLSEQQMRDIADPSRAPTAGLPTIEDAARSGGFLAGPPELIIERLSELGERYPGLRRVTMSQPISTPQSSIMEQLERFASEVMPAFKSKAVEPATFS